MGRFRRLGSGFVGQRGVWSLVLASALVVAGLVTFPVRAVASPVSPVPAVSPSQVTAADAYESFVQASYQDFLGKELSPSEVVAKANALRSGALSLSDYMTTLSTSDEWLDALLTRIYKDTLQRNPDPGGLSGWKDMLRSHQYTVAQVASFFYASDEYFNNQAGGSPSTWVTQLYQKLLNRNPDPLGLAYWIDQTNNPKFGRTWVGYNFYQSDESRMKRVDTLYQTLLSRGPDPVGLAFWKVQVLSTGDLVLATQIADSQEYWEKAHVRFPTIVESPTIVTSSLPTGMVGSPYSATLTGSGGRTPYTWWDFDALGFMGLTVDPTTGVIHGTPNAPMNAAVTFRMVDAANVTVVKALTLTISPLPLTIVPSLPLAVVGSVYSAALVGNGGEPPYTWAATGLPSGLSLDPGTGVVSGTATVLGSSSVTVTLTDKAARTTTAAVSLVVAKNEAARQISAGGGYHTCAVTSGGGVKCWGANDYGQLGDGTTVARTAPVDVVGLSSGVAAVVAGAEATCAVTTGGAVKCWGYNGDGELGNGASGDRSTPVGVVGLSSGVTALSFDFEHVCALTSAGKVKCWGLNDRSQLGDGTTISRSAPVDVVGVSGATAVAAGQSHSCALTSGGVKCWGANDNGQLGDSTTTSRPTPVSVTGLSTGVTALSAGDFHTCAVTSGAGVTCWGLNASGQLGDNTTTDRSSPVAVTGLGAGLAVVLSSGGSSNCVVTSGGGAKCWGDNAYGSLGDGTSTNRPTPVAATGLTSGVIAISAGWEHSCAVTTGGRAMCWGANDYGELGDRTTNARLVPGEVYGILGN